MKTNYFSLLLALLLSMVSTTALAYDACIDGIYYNFSGTEASVTYKDTNYNSYYGDIVIPESVVYNGTTYNVTTINDKAFLSCSGLTSIVIPKSIKIIGNEAFSRCSSLAIVNISEGVMRMGQAAFQNCSNLNSIVIPSSMTMIGYAAFLNTGIYSNSPKGVFYVDKWVCGYKGTMPTNSSINLKDGSLGIADWAFDGCTRLFSITIPNSVTSIGYSSFYGCTSLTSVDIPNSVTSIANDAFNGCTGLTSVTVDISTPLTISYYTFSNRANATLYVPYGSKAAYELAAYWNGFKEIVEMEPKICATPELTYQNGKIHCTCETEDVEYVYTIITTNAAGKCTDGVIPLGTQFSVSVRATRDGYEDSEPATITIDLASVGDMNGDGIISIADVTGLVNVILGK